MTAECRRVQHRRIAVEYSVKYDKYDQYDENDKSTEYDKCDEH
jgi:hypothetical protein